MKTLPKVAVFLLLDLMLLALVASAQGGMRVDTGNDLLRGLQACDNIDTHTEYRCALARGYIAGASDAWSLVTETAFPAHTTNGQVCDVVRKYLENHLENRQRPSVELIGAALHGAWGQK